MCLCFFPPVKTWSEYIFWACKDTTVQHKSPPSCTTSSILFLFIIWLLPFSLLSCLHPWIYPKWLISALCECSCFYVVYAYTHSANMHSQLDPYNMLAVSSGHLPWHCYTPSFKAQLAHRAVGGVDACVGGGLIMKVLQVFELLWKLRVSETYCGSHVVAPLHHSGRELVGRHCCHSWLVKWLSWLLFKPGQETMRNASKT